MTGRELHTRWQGAAITDVEGAWTWLTPGDQARWERLAAEVAGEVAIAEYAAASEAVHWVANEVTDAWDRREQRRCPSMT